MLPDAACGEGEKRVGGKGNGEREMHARDERKWVRISTGIGEEGKG
jgi:hypothetical protein